MSCFVPSFFAYSLKPTKPVIEKRRPLVILSGSVHWCDLVWSLGELEVGKVLKVDCHGITVLIKVVFFIPRCGLVSVARLSIPCVR